MQVVQTFIVEINGIWTTLYNCGEQGWWYSNIEQYEWTDTGLTEIETDLAEAIIKRTKENYSKKDNNDQRYKRTDSR